jgi:hypothetical protein
MAKLQAEWPEAVGPVNPWNSEIKVTVAGLATPVTGLIFVDVDSE